MMVGNGVSTYDLSSMEKYGHETTVAGTDHVAASSGSQVVGLQSMFRAHRKQETPAVSFN